MEPPLRIYVSGLYRSGTTLITRILNNHPQLWVTFDSVHFMRFSYGRFDPISKVENAVNLTQEIAQRIKRRWQMSFDLDSVISHITSQKQLSYASVYDLIMQSLMKVYKPNAIGWGEKTNVCWGKIPAFLEMFPQGKIIHIIRDPRDVLCSFKKITYEPGYAYLDTAFCALSSFSKADEYQRTFDPKNYMTLKYENILTHPVQEIEKVCQFLEIEYHPDLLKVENFIDKAGQWWPGESSFEPEMRTLSQNPIGRWKHHANPMDVYFVEYINKAYLKKYDYPLSDWKLEESSHRKLFQILEEDPILQKRFLHWKNTGEGTEAYPSDPLLK